jgi:hypothetical protein
VTVDPDVTSAFERWESEAWSILTPLMAALNVADRVARGPEAVLAISDQFRALSQDAAIWISENPCPASDLAILFTMLVRSYGTAADSLAAEAKNPNGADWSAIDREFAGLHNALPETLSTMRASGGVSRT